MSVPAIYKFQLKNLKRNTSIYYIVIVLISLISLAAAIVFDRREAVVSFDFTGSLFIFIYAVTGVREDFKFFTQNSVSRKRFFRSRLLILLAAALAMTLMDQILFAAFSIILRSTEGLSAYSFFGTFVADKLHSQSSGQTIIYGFLMYTSAFGLGTFLNLLYYRISNVAKFFLPFVFALFLLFVDTYFNGIILGYGLLNLISYITKSFGRVVLSLSIITAGSMLFSGLLLRRAPVKE